MPVDLSDTLVVRLSSTALFDMSESAAVFDKALKENAYSISDDVQIKIFDDRIEVQSPDSPPWLRVSRQHPGVALRQKS